MKNQEMIRKITDFIEAHLEEELTVSALAKEAGFSPYHFCRLFVIYTGIPVMEYVRRRRLTRAVEDILSGRRIADTAADYGFATHSGFDKAFKKVYGYAPDEFCKRVSPHHPPAPNPLVKMIATELPKEPVCRMEHRDRFYIAGVILRTAADLKSVRELPALWKDYTVYDVDSIVYSRACPKEHGEYNLCFPVGDGLFRHVNGVKIDSPDSVENGLYIDVVPAACYAVFSTPPVTGTPEDFVRRITETWKYIYDIWFPSSGYEADTEGRDFEFYDERSHGNGPYSMEIWIPVKQKESEEHTDGINSIS